MSEDKVNVPNIRFPGFTDAWEQRRFDSMFDPIPNNTFSRADLNYDDGKIKSVHYGDILIKYGAVTDCGKDVIPFITGAEVSDHQSQLLQNGDVLIADAAEDETVGKATEIAGITGIPVVSGLHTIACRPKVKMQPNYLGYYMNSPSYHQQLLPLMQGIKVLSISRTNLAKTIICYPTSAREQLQIGKVFADIDHLITLHQRKLNYVKHLKAGLLQKMFSKNGEDFPEVRFPGFTDAWEQRRLLDGTLKIGDGLHGTPKYTDDGNVYFINGNNLVNGRIVITEETKRVTEEEQSKDDKALDDNTLLMSINGTIGNLAWYNGEKLMLGKSAAYITVSDFDKRFVYAYLQTPSIYSYFMNNLTGTTIKNLGLKTIRETQLLVPKKEEQEKIGHLFSNLDSLITLHQRKLEHLQQQKKSLLQQMFV